MPVGTTITPHAFPFANKNSDPDVNLSVSFPKQFFKNFPGVQIETGFWLAERTAPTCRRAPACTGSAPGLARAPREACPKCSSLARRCLPGPSRANAAKAWDGARGQPLGPGPALSRPQSGTTPASWGPGGREPRRHAVEETRRCRRLSCRSPAPAAVAASLLPPGPTRGGQGPGAAGSAYCSSTRAPFLPLPAAISVLRRQA